MYHVSVIHSSVDRYVGYFHVLSTVNCAAMNVRVNASLQTIILSGYMPRNSTE